MLIFFETKTKLILIELKTCNIIFVDNKHKATRLPIKYFLHHTGAGLGAVEEKVSTSTVYHKVL